MHHHNETRRISNRTPLLDHAGQTLGHYSRTEVLELMRRPGIMVIGNRKRITCLRFEGPDPALLSGGSKHKRQMGSPHKHENYWNVAGMWHIDRIPKACSAYYIAVLRSCHAAEAARMG